MSSTWCYRTVVNNLLSMIVARIKNGWLDRECDKDTTRVTGSINHCPAPAATQIDTTKRTTTKQYKSNKP